MAEAVTTNDFRKRLAAHCYNGSSLPRVSQMAFGDGGHNADGSVVQPDPDQTALNNERLRSDLVRTYQEDLYSVTAVGRINKAELVDVSVSEAGLLDADGNLMGFRNFAPKIKEADEEYEISIKLKF